MFKSKARKPAEFLLKVEKEKEKLQQREAAREAARQKAAEDIQKFIKACIDEYRTAYRRHPKATIVSTLTKGKLKTRVVDIQPGLAQLLAEYLPVKEGALFPGMRGRSPTLTRFAADKILRDACSSVGLEGVSTHS